MSSFDQAVEWITKSNISTSTPTKLKLYSLYKIATTTSRPSTPRPGMLDFSGRAKWDAWDNLGKSQNYERQEGKERAELEYVQEAIALGYREAGVEQSEEPPKRVEKNKEQAVSVSQIRDDFVDEAPLSKLHELSIEGDYPALEAFLSSEEGKASQIDQRDSYGYSALHLATDRGHTEIVKLLLAHGANGTATDEDGNTPLDLARLADHEELVNLLSAL
ncbi:hypothetical protein JCM5353_005764 [Sporobolomyces roseus]